MKLKEKKHKKVSVNVCESATVTSGEAEPDHQVQLKNVASNKQSDPSTLALIKLSDEKQGTLFCCSS